MRLVDCADCYAHYLSNPHIVSACASVGISHNRSTAELLTIFYRKFHADGHREIRGGWDAAGDADDADDSVAS